MVIVLAEHPMTQALLRSLTVLKDPKWIAQVNSTDTPSFITDVLLAIRDLRSRAKKEDQKAPYPPVVYAKAKDHSSTGFTWPSTLLAFLLTAREAAYPCIIDGNVRHTVYTKHLSRISPSTAVADAIKITSRAGFPAEESTKVMVPTLERGDVDSLRNLIHHWTRPEDGLDLVDLLDQNFIDLSAAFKQWDGNWYDRHHWRSFYAVCHWLSYVTSPLPERNGVQPSDACWQKWVRLFDGNLWIPSRSVPDGPRVMPT
jgi:hypothetical protein